MKRFTVDEVDLTASSKNKLQLKTPFTFYSDCCWAETAEIYVLPFYTDLASFPWYIMWWLKKYGKYNLPSILHDYLLQHPDQFPCMTRKMKDMIFREALIDQGVPDIQCKWIYRGVRVYSMWREFVELFR